MVVALDHSKSISRQEASRQKAMLKAFTSGLTLSKTGLLFSMGFFHASFNELVHDISTQSAMNRAIERYVSENHRHVGVTDFTQILRYAKHKLDGSGILVIVSDGIPALHNSGSTKRSYKKTLAATKQFRRSFPSVKIYCLLSGTPKRWNIFESFCDKFWPQSEDVGVSRQYGVQLANQICSRLELPKDPCPSYVTRDACLTPRFDLKTGKLFHGSHPLCKWSKGCCALASKAYRRFFQ